MAEFSIWATLNGRLMRLNFLPFLSNRCYLHFSQSSIKKSQKLGQLNHGRPTVFGLRFDLSRP